MADRAVKLSSSLYETDFYAWTQQQAELLRRGSTSRAELENIAEEIETLGRKEISELRSRYTILLLHLLKGAFQPQGATRSWKTTILEQRLRISRHMGDNPSLKSKADEIFAQAYADARQLAASETGLAIDTFPVNSPCDRDQASHED